MSKVAIILFGLVFGGKGIYGEDDRIDYFQMKDQLLLSLAGAVAAQIPNENLTQKENGKFTYNYALYGDVGTDKVCKQERFTHQQTGVSCTAFLVAPDILITAGHCMKGREYDCEDFQWAFDFKYDSSALGEIELDPTQLVRCSKVLDYAYTEDGHDYAVLKLERAMLGRTPLKIRQENKVGSNDLLGVIGFPAGLPMKFAINANVRDNTSDEQFVIDSDTFYGNSGSPVVNMNTGIVEGILVRGDSDYQPSSTQDCREVMRYEQNAGGGEDVIRITELTSLKDLIEKDQ